MSEALSNTPIAPVWWTVTHFGSSSLLLPAFVLVAFGLWRSGAQAAARHYVVAMTAAVALTVTSKCLFYGWGIGIAAIDFTGVSGHGLLAAAILPLLLRGLPGRWGRDLGAPLGAALALLVGVSRVVVGAHSVSEVVAAWLLGLAVSVPVEAIWADPKVVIERHAATDERRWHALADILQMTPAALLSKVGDNPQRRFVYLQRQVNPAVVDYVEELGANRLVHGMLGDQPLTAVLANTQAALDVLDHPDLEPAARERFLRVIREETSALGRRIASIEADAAQSLKTRWPLEDMLGADLVNAALRRMLQAMTHPSWAWDVGLMGKPHDLGNISAYRGNPTGLADYIGWLGDNFDPSISWKDLEWIREFWDGPMVIKGILDPQDARDAVSFGADGIVVSNHGGRQLDGVMSSARALPAIADAVKGELAILADSGIRTPMDLAGKRLMLMPAPESAELLITLRREGIDINQLTIQPTSFDLQDLLDGKTDAYNGYLSNEPFWLRQQQVPYRLIKPREYGVNFYNDVRWRTCQMICQLVQLFELFLSCVQNGIRKMLFSLQASTTPFGFTETLTQANGIYTK